MARVARLSPLRCRARADGRAGWAGCAQARRGRAAEGAGRGQGHFVPAPLAAAGGVGRARAASLRSRSAPAARGGGSVVRVSPSGCHREGVCHLEGVTVRVSVTVGCHREGVCHRQGGAAKGGVNVAVAVSLSRPLPRARVTAGYLLCTKGPY